VGDWFFGADRTRFSIVSIAAFDDVESEFAAAWIVTTSELAEPWNFLDDGGGAFDRLRLRGDGCGVLKRTARVAGPEHPLSRREPREGGNGMATVAIWSFTAAAPTVDLTGFKVEAKDGSIGKVDEATIETGSSYIVVDTGPWIFGKKVMLPAGVIRDVELDTETVFVDLTKDEIKSAPEFDEKTYRGDAYRNELGDYYSRGGTH
jgi:hypothetical protein